MLAENIITSVGHEVLNHVSTCSHASGVNVGHVTAGACGHHTTNQDRRQRQQQSVGNSPLGTQRGAPRQAQRCNKRNSRTLAEVIELLAITSCNVGGNPWGMGGVNHDTPGSTIKRMTGVMSVVGSSIHLIQEHKLGKREYMAHPSFTNSEWLWIAWPGKGHRQQGLAVLIHESHEASTTGHKTTNRSEIAYVVFYPFHSLEPHAVINVYFEPAQNQEDLQTSLSALQAVIQTIRDMDITNIYIGGDLNVDMLPNSLANGIAEKQEAMHDWQRLSGITRLDMLPGNKDWITRPGSATQRSSHLDAIMINSTQVTDVSQVHNLDWGTQDHTCLALEVSITTLRERGEGHCTRGKIHSPVKKDVRLKRVRYKYKEATDTHKDAYNQMVQAMAEGPIIRHLAELHSRLEPPVGLHYHDNLELVDRAHCTVAAALHAAAQKSMSGLKCSNKEARYTPHGKVQKSSYKLPSTHDHTMGCKKVEQSVWDKINRMRVTQAAQPKAKTAQVVSVTVIAGGIATTYRDPQKVKKEVVDHSKRVSAHDVDDPKFDAQKAKEVEAAVADIHASILRGEPIRHGAPTDDHAHASTRRPTRDECTDAAERMKQSEDGAPGLDGLMAWMILWPLAYLCEVLVRLFAIVWDAARVPEAWLMVLLLYMIKSKSSDPNLISSYRPLSLRSVLGKLFTRIIYRRLQLLLVNVYPVEQMGYKEWLGADVALWAVRQLFAEQLDEGKDVWMVLCDWQKAYDKVWRAQVMLLLHAYGVHANLWLLIYRWVHDTTYVADFNGVATDPFTLLSGLGQGCVLSALLFVLYISTLTSPAPPMHPEYKYKDLVTSLHGQALPTQSGMESKRMTKTKKVAAVIIADDTNMVSNCPIGINKLLDQLQNWRYMMRAEPNLTKYQFFFDANDPIKRAALRQVDVGIEELLRPRKRVKLVGGTITSDVTDKAMQCVYTPGVMMYSLTFERLFDTYGLSITLKFVEACPVRKFLRPASLDHGMVGNEHAADALQRQFWHSGHWGSTGIGTYSTHMVQHQSLSQLPWSARLKLERAAAWSSLTQITPADSWPGQVARHMHEEACNQLNAGQLITEHYTRQINTDMCDLGYDRGLRTHVKVRHNNARKLERSKRECSHMRDMLRHPPAPLHPPAGEGALDAPSRKSAHHSKPQWWNGSSLATSELAVWALGMAHARPNEDSEDEGSDTESETDNDASSSEDSSSEDAPWEGWEFKGTLKAWRKELTNKAQEQCILTWAKDRLDYKPSHTGDWAGSSCLWCHIHPGELNDDCAWKPIGLELLRNNNNRGERCSMMRLWAGMTPSLRSCRLVTAVTLTKMTVQEKNRWVQCPCGGGAQDSMHVLVCTNPIVQKIRDDAVEAAKASEDAPTRSGKTQKRRRTEDFDWSEVSPEEAVIISMGGYRQGITQGLLISVVSNTAKQWVRLNEAWALINLAGGDKHRAGT